MQLDLSSNLYKIGTGWLFDVDNMVGYKVERSGGSRNGEVKNFIEAFRIKNDDEKSDVNYSMEVPIGVVRKALQIIKVTSQGELKSDNE